MSAPVQEAYEAVGLGNVGSNSHPIHPAIVHFPFAFLTVSNFINIIYGMAIYLPWLSPMTPHQANIGALTIFGYYVNVIGIITAFPAALTGFAELYAMINARGLCTIDKKSGSKLLNPVVKKVLIHATLNQVILGGAVYHWTREHDRPHEDYRPYGHQVMLSAGAFVMLLYSGYLGGTLVYKHGVGVQRQGEGAEEKKESQVEVVEKRG